MRLFSVFSFLYLGVVIFGILCALFTGLIDDDNEEQIGFVVDPTSDFVYRINEGFLTEITEEEIAESALERQRVELYNAPIQTFVERAADSATFGLTDYLRGAESSYFAGKRVAYNSNAATIGEWSGFILQILEILYIIGIVWPKRRYLWQKSSTFNPLNQRYGWLRPPDD